MSLVWRLLSSSALVAGIVLSFSGCKSGGGWWAPGWAKMGSTSSASDLAVSRPTTKVPKPSSGATPSTPDNLASSSSPRTQNGPYGASSISDRTSPATSTYKNQPAAWQGEPHSSVAPAGGYQTGGAYSMASRPSQPGVTPGAYSQPAGGGAYPESRTSSQAGQPLGQAEPAADAYSGAGAYGGAALPEAGAAGNPNAPVPRASIYPDANPAGDYAAPDPAAGSGVPPPSDAPGAVMEPAATTAPANQPLFGDGTSTDSTYATPEVTNPAATGTSSAASPAVISNPYSLPSSPPTTTRPATSPAPTTSPSSSTAPFAPPTLPSSLSGAPGGYRPGSTAAPGSRYGAQNPIYEPPVTASGTGYPTADGTIMR